jgi:hypothetical protein
MKLTLIEDCLDAGVTVAFPASPGRAVYVCAGSILNEGAEIATDGGFAASGAVTLTAGAGGACLWRFDLGEAGAGGPGHRAVVKLSGEVPAHLRGRDAFIRLDAVAFPPGGTALLHTHRGPGIRCLREGTIRIDTQGHTAAYGPGSPWFETGPDPVFAQADMGIQSRFIRAMVLPEELAGKSSIRYENPDDKDKPKSQSYRQFGEAMLVV